MLFEKLLNKITTNDWHDAADQLYAKLKPELQTQKGFIRSIKEQNEQDRKDAIEKELNQFNNSGTDNLDGRINLLISTIEEINNSFKTALQYDLIETIYSYKDIKNYPCLYKVKGFLKKDTTSLLGYNRVCAILYNICNHSLLQANKSNAGTAGESMVRAIFNSVELYKDIHFSEQHKSKKGSDTDFVFPCVSNFDESNIEVLVAAQLSTNDRGRLASSELKQGGIKYLVTGNGLDAATKNLQSISHEILQSFENENIRIVCFKDEITIEKKRVENRVKNSNGEAKEKHKARLKYLNSHTLSYASLAKKLEHYKLRPISES